MRGFDSAQISRQIWTQRFCMTHHHLFIWSRLPYILSGIWSCPYHDNGDTITQFSLLTASKLKCQGTLKSWSKQSLGNKTCCNYTCIMCDFVSKHKIGQYASHCESEERHNYLKLAPWCGFPTIFISLRSYTVFNFIRCILYTTNFKIIVLDGFEGLKDQIFWIKHIALPKL